MTREYMIGYIERKGHYSTSGYRTIQNFADFCNVPILEDLVSEGLVVKEKKSFFKRLFSNKETYIYTGEMRIIGRIVSDVDPYGEEDWTS